MGVEDIDLKFISYEHECCLCDGVLIMELNGKEIVFPEGCLESKGYTSFIGDPDGEDFDVIFNKGDWVIDEFPVDFPEELKSTATELVNKNIEHGCCGACW